MPFPVYNRRTLPSLRFYQSNSNVNERRLLSCFPSKSNFNPHQYTLFFIIHCRSIGPDAEQKPSFLSFNKKMEESTFNHIHYHSQHKLGMGYI